MSGGAGPPADQAPWDLGFIRVGALVTAVATLVAAPVVGLVRGWGSGVAVVVGAAVVTFFFWVSGVVIARAGQVHDSFTLPAAMGTFLVKALVLFALLGALPADGWLDRRVLGFTVIAGALLWSGVQMRWVWTRQVYYTAPPAPPRSEPTGAPGAAAGTDPESPATRG